MQSTIAFTRTAEGALIITKVSQNDDFPFISMITMCSAFFSPADSQIRSIFKRASMRTPLNENVIYAAERSINYCSNLIRRAFWRITRSIVYEVRWKTPPTPQTEHTERAAGCFVAAYNRDASSRQTGRA